MGAMPGFFLACLYKILLYPFTISRKFLQGRGCPHLRNHLPTAPSGSGAKTQAFVRIAPGSARTGPGFARVAPGSARLAQVSVRLSQGSVPILQMASSSRASRDGKACPASERGVKWQVSGEKKRGSSADSPARRCRNQSSCPMNVNVPVNVSEIGLRHEA